MPRACFRRWPWWSTWQRSRCADSGAVRSGLRGPALEWVDAAPHRRPLAAAPACAVPTHFRAHRQPEAAVKLVETTDLCLFLARRIQTAAFDQNKLYASELLSVLLQSEPRILSSFMGSKVRRARQPAGAAAVWLLQARVPHSARPTPLRWLQEMDSVDQVLQACAQWRKRDPESPDEEECCENVYNVLSCLLVRCGGPVGTVALTAPTDSCGRYRGGRRAARSWAATAKSGSANWRGSSCSSEWPSAAGLRHTAFSVCWTLRLSTAGATASDLWRQAASRCCFPSSWAAASANGPRKSGFPVPRPRNRWLRRCRTSSHRWSRAAPAGSVCWASFLKEGAKRSPAWWSCTSNFWAACAALWTGSWPGRARSARRRRRRWLP